MTAARGIGGDLRDDLCALAPIGLAELNAHAALQDRVDVKYVVSRGQLDELLAVLAKTHRALEIDGRRSFVLRTTYYDTLDMLTLREHVQQRRRRFKCRKRRYVDSARSMIEVKLKGARGRTVKHAMACDPADDLRAEELDFLRAVVQREYGRRFDVALHPALTATCRRLTIAAPQLGERLTCDVQLDFGDARLDDRLAIVESKSRCGGAVADRALRGMGVRPVSGCSKYLIGIALTRDGVRDNDLRPLLRRYFVSDARVPGASSRTPARTWTSTRVTSRT